MLTQQQLAAAQDQARHEQQEIDGLWSGAMGQLFIAACLVMTLMSYCTQKSPTQAPQRAKAVVAESKPATAAKAHASAVAKK